MESVVTAVGDNSGQELDLDQALAWVEANKPTIPACVYNTVKVVAKLRTDFQEAKGRANRLLALFRTQLGLLPKSERGTAAQKDKLDAKANTQTPEEHLAALKARKARLLAEIRRYEERIGKGRKNKKKTSTSPNSDTALEQQIPEHAFERCSEELFSGKLATAQDGGERLKVPKQENFENPRGLHSTSDDRTRYDFGVTTKTLKLQVETLTDPRTGKSVTASTDHIGPPNSQATWSAIANTITAVIGYAIPINRLSAMLKGSCPYFTSARLCSYLKMAAELFEPIYICLGENLADADVLHGDDTKARVVEISNALKDGGSLQDATEGSLIAKVAEVFGRVFLKKRGTGTKCSLNVSVVIGKTNVADPRLHLLLSFTSRKFR